MGFGVYEKEVNAKREKGILNFKNMNANFLSFLIKFKTLFFESILSFPNKIVKIYGQYKCIIPSTFIKRLPQYK